MEEGGVMGAIVLVLCFDCLFLRRRYRLLELDLRWMSVFVRRTAARF
jgi:hypothetical protein